MSTQKYRRALELDEEPEGPGMGMVGGGVFEPGDGLVQASGESTGRGPGVSFSGGAKHWRSRTLLEKILIVVVIVLVFLIFVLTIMLGTRSGSVRVEKYPVRQNYTFTYEKEANVCLRQTCVQTASRILEYMDRSVSPCNDFYSFACGGWIQSRSIPPGHAHWSTFLELNQKNELVMRTALEEPTNTSESSAEQKAKMFYKSCRDTDTINRLDSQPLLDLLDSLGGWKMLPDNSPGGMKKSVTFSDPKSWNFQRVFEDLFPAIGLIVYPLIQFGVDTDEKNSTINIIQMDQGALSLGSRDYYINRTDDNNKKAIDAYMELMKDVGKLLGVPEDNMKEFDNILEFETQLANIMLSEEERRDADKLYNKMPIGDLEAICPLINWLSFFNSQFKRIGVQLTKDEKIVLHGKDYLGKMCTLLKETLESSSNASVVHNYLMWLLVKPLSTQLSDRFQRVFMDFEEAFKGVKGREEKWRECVDETQSSFGMPVGAMFVKKVFKGDSKAVAHKMIKEIETAFKDTIRDVDWMDEETRALGLEKVDRIDDMIGFPDYIFNITALDDEYKWVTINESTFFKNFLNIYSDIYTKTLTRLREGVKKRWEMSPQTINAYYKQTKNQIVFPAGILQSPFYSRGFPKSLNYGAIGVVVGHEITHGFDDQGRKYDAVGNMRHWWNNQTVEAFESRSKCMENQYSNYSMFGHAIRGKQTLGENIADNGGLKAAYTAFKNYEKLHGVEKPLPAIDFNQDQLFFLAFAQIWCRKARPQAVIFDINSDPHTPDEYRVKGTLSNSLEFARAYKCPKGSPMNPVNKCVVW